MFQAVLTVARNTFTEAIRQPVYVVLLLSALLLLAINPTLSAYTFDDDDKLLIDMGLSTMFLAGLLLSAFCATGVFSREIENKTVLTIVSKPVGRPSFVLGKYLGVTAAITVAYTIWSLGFLLTVRHGVMATAGDAYDGPVWAFGLSAIVLALGLAALANYFYRWVFSSSLTFLLLLFLSLAYLLVLLFGKGWEPQALGTDLNPQLLVAVLLTLEAIALLCAVAIAASTRLGQVMTLSICGGIFLLGLSSDYLFGRHADGSLIATLGHAVMPNLQYLWLADALTQGHPVSAYYVGLVSAYSALFTIAVLGLATALFQTREVG